LQTRTHSLIEAVANIIAGYFVAVGGQIVIFPWFGMSSVPHPRFRDLLLFALVVAPAVACLLLGASGFFEALPSTR